MNGLEVPSEVIGKSCFESLKSLVESLKSFIITWVIPFNEWFLGLLSRYPYPCPYPQDLHLQHSNNSIAVDCKCIITCPYPGISLLVICKWLQCKPVATQDLHLQHSKLSIDVNCKCIINIPSGPFGRVSCSRRRVNPSKLIHPSWNNGFLQIHIISLQMWALIVNFPLLDYY